jgi:hypothetical protein
MKNLYKFFLALGVYSTVFSQIPEIKRLPVQEISQSITESAPIWLSTNEILIFYVSETRDTIFSTKSSDRGLKWSQPNVVSLINISLSQGGGYLTGIKSSTGRVLLAWSIFEESMKLIYSDNNGTTWSEPISILGGGWNPVFQKRSSYLNLTEWNNGELCLSFLSQGTATSYFKISSDMGVSWSEAATQFPRISNFETRELSIISADENKLLAVFENHESFQNIGIYSRISTDNGNSWGEATKVADEIHHEQSPRITKLIDGTITIVYLKDNVDFEYQQGLTDVYYKVSEDNGNSWSGENQFTRYVGEDFNINISSLQNSTFITFSTERYSTYISGKNTCQIVYGILGESVDSFTPPKVFETFVPQEFVDINRNKFVYQAVIVDDQAVSKVLVSVEDSIYNGEMFDDGLHFDGEANDSLFGNEFPIIYYRYLDRYRLNINKLDIPFDNEGVLADVNVSSSQKINILSYDISQSYSVYDDLLQFAGGSTGIYEEGSFLFSGGFFLSGYENGNLFANGVATASLVKDYLPGKVGSLPDDPLNVLYIVNKNDPPFGTSWRKWKDAVSLGAEFYDGDNDGIYNPIDKNWNRTWDINEDMPMLIGDETVWCVFNDGLPANQRRWQSDPQGIEVKQTIFASEDQELENIIFIRYSLVNTGTSAEVFDDVYFGIWEDADLGDPTDDVVGCDTLLGSGFFYNNTPDPVYGDNCPSFFTTLLQGPIIETNQNTDTAIINYGQLNGTKQFIGKQNIDISSHIFTIGGAANLNDPGSVSDVRNYLLGKNRVGQFPNPCAWPYGEVRGGIDCQQVNPRLWVSGDPVSDIGWISTQNRDARNLLSTGPFKLEKDKPQEIIIAYVIGRGTDPLNSITVARENVQRAIQEYKNNFASMTYSPPPPVPINDYVLYQNYPNPFNPITTIRYEIPQAGQVTIDIFDILGQRVKTLVDEYKQVGRYEVKFTSTGLASGVYIYQLRVNDFITSKKMVLIR